MARRPADPLRSSRRFAIAIMIFGPLIVCMALIQAFGSIFQPKHANFVSGDQAGIVSFDNDVTAFSPESDH